MAVTGDPSAWHGAMVLSAADFADHCRSGEALASKRGEVAVVAHGGPDDRWLVTKIWRPDRGRLASLLRPEHRRFRRALVALRERGFNVPRYLAHGRVADSGVRFVLYEGIDGEILRARPERLDLSALAQFALELHARGVYFRGLHLGNVVCSSDGRLGLIDVQDVRLRRRPLTRRQRARNLGILCAHPHDRPVLGSERWSELVLAYCRAAGMSVSDTAWMRDRVRAQIDRRGARRAARRRRRGLSPLS